MAPRRKKSDLVLQSIWDENLLTNFLREKKSSVKHATKIWNWMIQHPDASLKDIPLNDWSIPKGVVDGIRNEFVKFTTNIVEREISSRGDTTKLLIATQDGHRVEAVVMKHPSHVTVCISSQIGCQMGCKFCATGTMGIIGDLTSAEIIEQVIHANSILKIRNVVFMGMGEPLNNYENVKLALQFMVDPKRMALSPKHITVSTVGVVKNMYRLSSDVPTVNLALSLHAPNQTLRVQIVPTASAYKIDELMQAVDNHIAHQSKANNKSLLGKYFSRLKTNNVMIEYILIHNINDRDEHAHELAKLLAPRRHSILLNLIPYNPTTVAETFEPPSADQVHRFSQICSSAEYRLFTRIRQEMGQDIAGACGQLALVNPGTHASKETDRDIEDLISGQSAACKKTATDAATDAAGVEKDVSRDPTVVSSNIEMGQDDSNSVLRFRNVHVVILSTVLLVAIVFPLFRKLR